MAGNDFIREPKRDCIFCEQGRDKCRALNDLYCAKELRPCVFYKNADGCPKKES